MSRSKSSPGFFVVDDKDKKVYFNLSIYDDTPNTFEILDISDFVKYNCETCGVDIIHDITLSAMIELATKEPHRKKSLRRTFPLCKRKNKNPYNIEYYYNSSS